MSRGYTLTPPDPSTLRGGAASKGKGSAKGIIVPHMLDGAWLGRELPPGAGPGSTIYREPNSRERDRSGGPNGIIGSAMQNNSGASVFKYDPTTYDAEALRQPWVSAGLTDAQMFDAYGKAKSGTLGQDDPAYQFFAPYIRNGDLTNGRFVQQSLGLRAPGHGDDANELFRSTVGAEWEQNRQDRVQQQLTAIGGIPSPAASPSVSTPQVMYTPQTGIINSAIAPAPGPVSTTTGPAATPATIAAPSPAPATAAPATTTGGIIASAMPTPSSASIFQWIKGNVMDASIPYADRRASVTAAMQQYGVDEEMIAAAMREGLGNPNITAWHVEQFLSGQNDYFGSGPTMPPAPPAPAPSPTPAPTPAPGTAGPVQPPVQWPNTTTTGTALLPSPATWTVTPDQTVEGRIQNLIDPNHPINVQLRTQVMQQMAARGMDNSAMAESAVQDAIIRNAMQIAGVDAQTFAKAAGWNADQLNQFMTRNAEFENTFRVGNLDREQQWRIANLNADTQKTIAQMEITAKQQADAIFNANKTLLETNALASQAFNTAMSAINNLQNNDRMDAAAKTAAVANVWHDLQVQLKVLASVSGIDLTSQLNFSNYPGFDAQGNWIGFPNGVPGATPAPAPPPGSGGGGSGGGVNNGAGP